MKIGDFWRLVSFLLIGSMCGLLLDSLTFSLILALLLYIARIHFDLHLLSKWIGGRSGSELSGRSGIFEDLSYSLNQLFLSHQRRRKKLSGVLRQFEAATSAWPDAIVILNFSDEVEWANPAAKKYLDVRWPEDKKQRITNLVRLPLVRAFIEENQTEEETLDIASPTKSNAYLSLLLGPFNDTHRVLLARDTTLIRQANQARSDFVANVSHELKTPLTVLKGYAEMLAEQHDKAPMEWLPALEHMKVHANQMSELVNSLLELSRLDAGRPLSQIEKVDGEKTITAACSAGQALAANKNLGLQIQIDQNTTILGSKQELYSAFSNLIFNAIHYTPDGGTVVIRWGKKAKCISFEVEDNGIGIAPEHLNRVTERFYRIDGSRSRLSDGAGNGLGLAIVKHIVRRHGASLRIVSKVGVGSCFSIDFPLEEALQEKE
jgi:two-component system phosphate regulon sensor histidine kinase PhoR